MDDDLVDHLNKCRFCLDKIKSTRLAVQITEEIEQSFFSLTNSKLKTSKNYSSVICKTCLKELDSSVGFQQKIMSNQDRLQKFEFDDDTVPVKEELVEAEDLKTVEIKTECFDFELPPVVQSWQESLPNGDTQPDLEVDDEEVPQEPDQDGTLESDAHGKPEDAVPSVAATSDEESINNSSYYFEGSGDLLKEETQIKKLPSQAEPSYRVCPYCGQSFSKGSLETHIEAHENQINNTPLSCEFCDYQCFTRPVLKTHCKSRHPEKLPAKKKKKGIQEPGNEMAKRQKILEIIEAQPTWTIKKISKLLGVARKTVSRVMSLRKNNLPIDRCKRTKERARAPRSLELEKKIIDSFQRDPCMSVRKRAKLMGAGHSTIQKIGKKIGFKAEWDTSTQIYQCQQCPRKYSHNTTLTAHIKQKHMTPD